MRKYLLLLLSLACLTAYGAGNRIERPSALNKFKNNYDLDAMIKNLQGEIISFDFTDCNYFPLSSTLHFVSKDTTWIKIPKNISRARENVHFTLSEKPIQKELIASKQFKIISVKERIEGEIYRSFYKDVYLQDISDPTVVMIWTVETHCNHRDVSNAPLRIKIDKYQDIVTQAYVDGKNYYILDNTYGKPTKENGYTNYVKLTCAGCNWYLGTKLFSPIYESTYVSEDGRTYFYDEYRTRETELPITESHYKDIVNSRVKQLSEEGNYFFTLSKVTKPKNSSIKYGKTTTVESTDLVSKYQYEDNIISIIWVIYEKQCGFILKNKSDNTIKVVWDDASLIDENNSASKVYHKGIRLMDANNPQPATSVPKGAELNDLIAPTNKLHYSDGWVEGSIISNSKRYNPSMIGKTIRVIFPIDIKGVINEYEFQFDINWKFTYPEYHE